jgi:alpha,alpha-trehalose phosphorylase
MRYAHVQGDLGPLGEIGAETLVETARLWQDLGFYGADNRFHIHGVTGPTNTPPWSTTTPTPTSWPG